MGPKWSLRIQDNPTLRPTPKYTKTGGVNYWPHTTCRAATRTWLLLRSEIPSGKCAELRTMAANNSRVHPTRSLYYCLFAPHIWVLFFAHIPFVVNGAFSATPTERLQQYIFRVCVKVILSIILEFSRFYCTHFVRNCIFTQPEVAFVTFILCWLM